MILVRRDTKGEQRMHARCQDTGYGSVRRECTSVALPETRLRLRVPQVATVPVGPYLCGPVPLIISARDCIPAFSFECSAEARGGAVRVWGGLDPAVIPWVGLSVQAHSDAGQKTDKVDNNWYFIPMSDSRVGISQRVYLSTLLLFLGGGDVSGGFNFQSGKLLPYLTRLPVYSVHFTVGCSL